ncbi:hypothetical protein EDB81DRAFT_946466 [Dactylonectria macrodidyma]|uniref:Uncharacterized protein n=1 Tax=Dactylonectria macrodidyma TaxID=307937 RepID=A0A9P9J4W8_9HYPO|nr:hypothetical protein EDB81DRAFT_946466 [Dactylonectria macrodidyma]
MSAAPAPAPAPAPSAADAPTPAVLPAAERAHLLAMGVSVPDESPDQPLPETLAARARALTIPVLEPMTEDLYRSKRKDLMGVGNTRLALAFEVQRRRHKMMQELHNAAQRGYMTQVARDTGHQPPFGWRAHRTWLARQLARRAMSVERMEERAQGAEEAARLAFEQAKEHAALLGNATWRYGYRTLVSRRRHEALADASRWDCLG